MAAPSGFALCTFALIMTSIYIMRPIRREIAISIGRENQAAMTTLAAGVGGLLSPLLNWFVQTWPSHRFLLAPLFFLIFCGLLEFLFSISSILPTDYSLFLLLGVSGRLLPSLFWGTISDISATFDTPSHQYTYISIGGQVGSIFGSFLSIELVKMMLPQSLLHVCVCFIGISAVLLFLYFLLASKSPKPEQHNPRKAEKQSPSRGNSSWSSLLSSPDVTFLGFLSIDMVFYAFLGTLLDLQLTYFYETVFSSAESRFSFFAQLDLIASFLTILTQYLWSSGKFGSLNISMSHLLLFSPFITLVASMIPALLQTTISFNSCYIIRRVIVYSLSKPAREALYTIVSPSARYSAKTFIDTVAFRFGDLGGTWFFVVLSASLGGVGFEISYIISMLTLFWIPIRVYLGRHYMKSSDTEVL